jgi:hypothetical protein
MVMKFLMGAVAGAAGAVAVADAYPGESRVQTTYPACARERGERMFRRDPRKKKNGGLSPREFWS